MLTDPFLAVIPVCACLNSLVRFALPPASYKAMLQKKLGYDPAVTFKFQPNRNYPTVFLNMLA